MKLYTVPVTSTGFDSPVLADLRSKYARRIGVSGHRELPNLKQKDFQPHIDPLAEQALWEVEGTDSIVYTGMALGWDLAVARACDRLRIPYVAVIPCPNQAIAFTSAQLKLYTEFLRRANVVHLLWPQSQVGYCFVKALLDRNKVIVDNSTELFYFLDGRMTGGTRNTVELAVRKGLPVKNFWPQWEKFS